MTFPDVPSLLLEDAFGNLSITLTVWNGLLVWLYCLAGHDSNSFQYDEVVTPGRDVRFSLMAQTALWVTADQFSQTAKAVVAMDPANRAGSYITLRGQIVDLESRIVSGAVTVLPI